MRLGESFWHGFCKRIKVSDGSDSPTPPFEWIAAKIVRTFKEELAVELESFILMLSVLLEIAGAGSIIVCTTFRRTRWAGSSEIALIGCVCALGSVTIISAMLRLFCGLISGIVVVAMGVAAIYLTDHHAEENPFGPMAETPLTN